MPYYKNFREYLDKLEAHGKLIRISREINKDTMLHPLVRWQFRGGIAEEDRKAFLFENVVDVKGHKYAIPVAVGALAASKQIYAMGMNCAVEQIADKWIEVMRDPMRPVLVASGTVQEVVYTGKELDKIGGFGYFPIPISTPGFDNGPYLTASIFVTKDLETGIRNAGIYRGQIKSPRTSGVFVEVTKHIGLHWEKARQQGIPLPAAIVVGGVPAISYAAVQNIPYGIDEFAVAGAIAGEPIPMVKCKTIDIEVPADAEIVFEGIIRTDYLEPEGPFGESHGYIQPRLLNPVFELTALTHRRQPIFTSFISQLTPSESSKIKEIGLEAILLNHLRTQCSIRSVLKVALHEPLANLRNYVVLQMKDNTSANETMRAMYALLGYLPNLGKIMIAVNEDIDPKDPESVNWALVYRMDPQNDIQIIHGRQMIHGPLAGGGGNDRVYQPGTRKRSQRGEACLLMNACIKQDFPPVALPKRQYMEAAKAMWEELGLPRLTPKKPWFGYSLGFWNEEFEEEAQLALQGEHYKVGEKLAGCRIEVDKSR